MENGEEANPDHREVPENEAGCPGYAEVPEKGVLGTGKALMKCPTWTAPIMMRKHEKDFTKVIIASKPQYSLLV